VQAGSDDLLKRASETMQAVLMPGGQMVWVDKHLDPGILGSLSRKSWQYSETMCMVICEKIRSGTLMKDIIQDPGMPPYSVLSRWRMEHAQFAESLVQARRDRAEILKEEVLVTAEEALRDAGIDERVQAAKLKVDALKWVASVDNPERFGVTKKDSISVGSAIIMIDTGIRREAPRDVGGTDVGQNKLTVNDDKSTANIGSGGNTAADIVIKS